MPVPVDYNYLKQWLSQEEIRKISQGENPLGKKLSRQQVWKIMKGKSKNFEFRNILVLRAQHNERLNK